MTSNILEVQGLCKKYDSFALKDVTFSVPKSFISGSIGQNGAEKTTTIKSILNIINTDSGSITLFGKENTIESNKGVGVVMDILFIHF